MPTLMCVCVRARPYSSVLHDRYSEKQGRLRVTFAGEVVAPDNVCGALADAVGRHMLFEPMVHCQSLTPRQGMQQSLSPSTWLTERLWARSAAPHG